MITLEHVLIRSIELADLDILTKWNFDTTINQFFPPKLPNSRIEQEEWFKQQVGPNKKKLIAIDTQNNTPFALIGFINWDQLNRHCEIGITVGNRDYWGNRLVLPTFSAALRFGFENMNLQIIHLRVFESNVRAIAFFEKCGFRREGVLRNRIFKDGSYHGWLSMSVIQQELLNI